jgi:hypothetical protein
MKDLGIGFGVFEKIVGSRVLKTGSVLSIGMMFLYVQVSYARCPQQQEKCRYFCDVAGSF